MAEARAGRRGGGGADRMGIRKQCVGLLTYRPGLDKEAQDQDLSTDSADSESLHRNVQRGPGSLQIWSHHQCNRNPLRSDYPSCPHCG